MLINQVMNIILLRLYLFIKIILSCLHLFCEYNFTAFVLVLCCCCFAFMLFQGNEEDQPPP